jgi:methylenetetrahydrofolate reductase (NADPH)
MIGFCKARVPEHILSALEPLKNDDEEVRKFGIEFGIKQCHDFIDHGFRFLHFYTMNLERSVIEIIKGLGVIDTQRDLPFKKTSVRAKEDVRPIFWAIKPKSYIARTQEWDEFPNGRWGVSRSPAFGEPEQYY